MHKINVFLVDDHKLFREGLKLLLGNIEFIKEVYEAGSGKEFLDRINEVDCDIVLMDIEMSDINGIEATKQAMELRPELNIIALSMYGEEMYYYKMIDAGAKGFLLKDSSVEIVQEAMEAVCDGSSYFSEELLYSILKNMRSKKQSEEIVGDLSQRELEILYYVCKGYSNQEIADELCISKRTVDKHRGNLLSKTQCKNTASLVMFAIKNNLVEV